MGGPLNPSVGFNCVGPIMIACKRHANSILEVNSWIGSLSPHPKRASWNLRARLFSRSLFFRNRSNDQLAMTLREERRISLDLGGVKQFSNFWPA